MKNIIIIVVLILVLITSIFIASRLQTGAFIFPFNLSGNQKTQATINDQSFDLEVAETDSEKQIGLSSKSKISDKEGMLFRFDESGIYSFWMKNMKFPIDIIFINDNKIVTIHKNAQPLKENENPVYYKPDSNSDTVVEINSGLSDKHGFKVGDTVSFK